MKRNRVKRQIREAYRKNKNNLTVAASEAKMAYALGFIFMADELFPSTAIDESISRLLTRLREKIVHRHLRETKEKTGDETNGQYSSEDYLKSVRLASALAHPLLSKSHHSLHTSLLSLHPNMLGVCPTGNNKAWSTERTSARSVENIEM